MYAMIWCIDGESHPLVHDLFFVLEMLNELNIEHKIKYLIEKKKEKKTIYKKQNIPQNKNSAYTKRWI